MKNLIFILLIISALNSSAQNYDLIITTQGDSIACHIDSITDINIHFKMKVNNRWLQTNTPKAKCTNYEFDVLGKDSVVFKPGTSYVKGIVQVKHTNPTYDLIVTNEGDSIACHIDSITDAIIYFEFKFKNHWVHTNFNLDKVAEYKHDQFGGKYLIFKEGSSYIKEVKNESKYFDRNIYSNRYLFAPSAFPMKDGLFSYSNITLGLHDLQYGFSDKFSMGLGTTMFFFPSYFMANYSIPINDNSSFAIGDLLMFSPYSDLSFFGNLFYGMYTKGTSEKNFSIGLGLWTTPDCEVAGKTISPALNFSFISKTSYNNYFITELYGFQYNVNQGAENISSPDFHFEEKFLQNKYVLGGISGFRVIGKRHPRNSWQFALAYLIIISEDIPEKYKDTNWQVWGEYDNTRLIPWPIISYTRKF